VNLDLAGRLCLCPRSRYRWVRQEPYNGGFPVTLVRPDRNNFAPRLASPGKPYATRWSAPDMASTTTPVPYQSIVQNMAFQPPVLEYGDEHQSPTTVLTLQNDFHRCLPDRSANNFGVDPKTIVLGMCRSGMWTCNSRSSHADHEPRLTGTKGTRLDVLEAPNRTEDRSPLPRRAAVLLGDRWRFDRERLSVRVRKRLQRAFSIWRPLHLLEIAGQRLDYRKWRADCGPRCRARWSFPE